MFSAHYQEILDAQLAQIIESLPFLYPELAVSAGLCLLVLFDLIFPRRATRVWSLFTLLVLAVTFGLTVERLLACGCRLPEELFLGMIQLNPLAVWMQLIFLAAAMLTVAGALRSRLFAQKNFSEGAEFFSFLLAMVLGLHFLAMSSNWLSFYIALELVSIASYLMTALHFDKRSAEGSIKYLIFGATASGIMLYGISWLYGFTGTLFFESPQFWEALSAAPVFPVSLALFFALGGLLFKLALVPFHFWAPDVYEAAPSPVAAFFSVAPKAGALMVLLRLYPGLVQLDAFSGLFFWRELLFFIALATVLLGNLAALRQSNLKRLMAYSSVAHAGFLLGALLLNSSSNPPQILLFYLISYLPMNFAVFYLADWAAGAFEKEENPYEMSLMSGWGLSAPFVGIAFVLLMIALTGLPPTAGFTAKLLLFAGVWETYSVTGSKMMLLFFGLGLFSTAAALFYYLKVPYYMFLGKPVEGSPGAPPLHLYDMLFLLLLLLPALLLFFRPDFLMILLEKTL